MAFKHLADEMESRHDVDVSIVNMNLVHHSRTSLTKLFAFFGLVRDIWVNTKKADIVFLFASGHSLYLNAPLTVLIAQIQRKPIIIRKGTGRDYRILKALPRLLVRWALRKSDMYLPETKSLVFLAREDNIGRVEWMPNFRPMVPSNDLPGREVTKCCRFVFVSQMKRDKGLEEIIEAAAQMSSEASVDLYGPFFDEYTRDSFAGLKNIQYKGVVAAEDVIPLLQQYDALLLPSRHLGEGHPGILIEALAAGIPSITSRWLSIQEVIDEKCGLLVEPRDAQELYQAMKQLHDDVALYRRLCDGVRKKREEFAVNRWGDELLKYCRELTNR